MAGKIVFLVSVATPGGHVLGDGHLGEADVHPLLQGLYRHQLCFFSGQPLHHVSSDLARISASCNSVALAVGTLSKLITTVEQERTFSGGKSGLPTQGLDFKNLEPH